MHKFAVPHGNKVISGDDDVVAQTDAQRQQRIADAAGGLHIVMTGQRQTARMVVRQDDARRLIPDGELDQLADAHIGRAGSSPAHFGRSEHLTFHIGR